MFERLPKRLPLCLLLVASFAGCAAEAQPGDDDGSEEAVRTSRYAIDSASAAKLPRPMLSAVLALRERTAENHLRDRALYDYAYYVVRNADPSVSADERAANVMAMTPIATKAKEAIAFELRESGRDVDAAFDERLAPYLRIVRLAYDELPAASRDRDSVRLARSGEEAFRNSAFLHCIDYAKALADRAQSYGMAKDDLRIFVAMDSAAYGAMCPAGSEGKAVDSGAARPVVHTLVAYRKGGEWSAISPEMDVTKRAPEIFALGRELPARLTTTFTLEQAPFVAGKTLVNAGAFRVDDPLLSGATPPQTFKNVTANGTLGNAGRLSAAPEDFVCTSVPLP